MLASDLDSEELEGTELEEFVVVEPVLSLPGSENDLYTRFGPGLLTGGLYSDEAVDPRQRDRVPRDWAILEDCRLRLAATGLFDGIYLSDASEDPGVGSSEQAIAILSLQEFDSEDYQDTLQGRLTKWTLTIAARDRDPAARDERAARLYAAVKDALDHKCLAGYTYPDWTVLRRARWEKPKDAERRLTIAGEWGYSLDDSEDP